MPSEKLFFDGESYETKIMLRDSLSEGSEIEGPVVVEEQSATTIVPPGWTLMVDTLGNLVIRRSKS